MMKKVKALLGLLKTEPIADREDLAQVCTETAVAELKRDTLKLQMDAEVLAVTDKYAGRIEALQREIDGNTIRINTWAVANRAEYGEKQSLFVHGHELRFRKSPEAVGFADGRKEDDVVEVIVNLPVPEDADPNAPTLADTVLRVKASLDKNAVKREWRLKTHRPALEAAGVMMVETESFEFIANRSELDTVSEGVTQVKEAA